MNDALSMRTKMLLLGIYMAIEGNNIYNARVQ